MSSFLFNSCGFRKLVYNGVDKSTLSNQTWDHVPTSPETIHQVTNSFVQFLLRDWYV